MLRRVLHVTGPGERVSEDGVVGIGSVALWPVSWGVTMPFCPLHQRVTPRTVP
uniref:Uncharacterized protein n=1 Tax=Anguilla anguilla TaxID=7936 RepID=A0A0E9USL3_ANGAN